MNYLRALFDVTAMLLLYASQMKESNYSVVISRYIYENKQYWDADIERRYVDAVGILLSLERNPVLISKADFDTLAQIISSVSTETELLSTHFSHSDLSVMQHDLKTAMSVIDYYSNIL